MNINRRFFLGGALSLIAATTFKPSIAGNMPTIYGDGVTDDSGGLYALLNNEPVLFNKEQIGVEDHKGIVFHNGRFVVNNTIEIPNDCNILFETKQGMPPKFIGINLGQQPFFSYKNPDVVRDFTNKHIIFEVKPSHIGKLLEYKTTVSTNY